MAKALTTEQEALAEVIVKVNEAIGKRWMVAVWSVTNDEKGEPKTVEPAGRVTWKFPAGDFEMAVELLKQSIEEEIGDNEPPVPSPLKLADFGAEEVEEVPSVEKEATDLTSKERSGPELPRAMSIGEFMQEREKVEE